MRSGQIQTLERTHAHGVRFTHEDGEEQVCHLTEKDIKRLLRAMNKHGLNFRINDGLVYEDFWVHFLKPDVGLEGVAFITGQRVRDTDDGNEAT